MPFDPIDYRPKRPEPFGPGPSASTEGHEFAVLIALAIAGLLILTLAMLPSLLITGAEAYDYLTML